MRKPALPAFLSVVVLCCSFLFSASASAQIQARQDVPSIIVSGMEAYRPGNADDAIRAWLKGGPLEGNKAAMSEANNLRDAQDFYGAFQWFDVISNREISSRVRIVYLAMNYDRGPLFARFVAYHTDRGWYITSFDFNMDDTKILPATAQ